jgi:hypothetical protein
MAGAGSSAWRSGAAPGRTTAPSPAPITTAAAGPRALAGAATSTLPSTTSAVVSAA